MKSFAKVAGQSSAFLVQLGLDFKTWNPLGESMQKLHNDRLPGKVCIWLEFSEFSLITKVIGFQETGHQPAVVSNRLRTMTEFSDCNEALWQEAHKTK